MLQDPALKQFAGDNFVRKSGDFHGFEALQLHSLTAQGHGQNINIMVRPYLVGLLRCLRRVRCSGREERAGPETLGPWHLGLSPASPKPWSRGSGPLAFRIYPFKP